MTTAGSAGPAGQSCGNCGALLRGPYCHHCGQAERSPIRELSALLGEALESFLSLESKTLRSLGILFFRPGRLTLDYLRGRRARHLPPLRLYLTASVLAFLLLGAFGSGPRIQIEDGDRSPGVEVQFGPSPRAADGMSLGAVERRGVLYFGERPWHRTENPLQIDWLDAEQNARLNDGIAQLERTLNKIRDDLRLPTATMWQQAPMLMFVLLPVFALVLQLVYLGQRRRYLEHLIIALHGHGFIFLVLSAGVLLGALARHAPAAIATGATLLEAALEWWLPIHLLLFQKRVYGQGWGWTLFKYGLIASLYLVLATLAVILGALVSVIGLSFAEG